MNFFLLFFGILIGIFIGACLIPRGRQRTRVVINQDNVSFTSNRLQDDDEYEIFLNGNLVSQGIVKNNEWTEPIKDLTP